MSESTDRFKRAPKRKTAQARTLTVSPEAKAAYEKLIREKEERESYARNLPADQRPR